jgi:hypothetical protein
VQFSFSFLLRTIDFKAEKKERDDSLILHDSRARRARH